MTVEQIAEGIRLYVEYSNTDSIDESEKHARWCKWDAWTEANGCGDIQSALRDIIIRAATYVY